MKFFDESSQLAIAARPMILLAHLHSRCGKYILISMSLHFLEDAKKRHKDKVFATEDQRPSAPGPNLGGWTQEILLPTSMWREPCVGLTASGMVPFLSREEDRYRLIRKGKSGKAVSMIQATQNLMTKRIAIYSTILNDGNYKLRQC